MSVNGDFHPIKPTLSTQPDRTPVEAVASAIAATGVPSARVETMELVVVDPGWYGDPPTGARLAYYVVVGDWGASLKEAFFIDAHSGETLDRWSALHTSRFRSVHDYTAGSDCCFPHGGPLCETTLCEAEVCDGDEFCCQVEWDLSCAARAAGICDGLCIPGPVGRVEGDGPALVSEVDAVFDYLGDVYEYFFRGFGRDGLDNQGLTMQGVAHWAFGCPNAFWDGDLLLAVFCPGVSPDDVVAHEMTHGLTQMTAGLIYQNQPGQLNESFSDVFGELVDLYNGGAETAGTVTGTPWEPHISGPGGDKLNLRRTQCSPVEENYGDGVRWLVSEDALDAFGGAIRDMWDPTCFGDPDRANSPLQTCDFIDSGGVHSGSGIPNHAFALLADGGSFNGHTIRGLGTIKSGAVWYRALTTYLTVASDFQSAYAAFRQAAADLIGTFPNDPRTGLVSSVMFTADDAEQVDQALQAVEMHTPGACGRVTPVLFRDPVSRCFDARVLFEDDFEIGANGWTVGNSAPPTPYDWMLRGDLPFRRAGTAWFAADPAIGDCGDVDETALHSLISPPIAIPEDAGMPYVSFVHYVETEPGYDGGILSVRVNGGSWESVPGDAMEFNTYNGILRDLDRSGNTNPLAGQSGWTGLGGEWGTTIADLSGLAGPGDVIEIRFDFGKDGCTGFTGWFVDDFSVYLCGDCDRNGRADQHEIRFRASSGPMGPFSANDRQTFTLDDPPRAVGDVTLRILAQGDFASEFEYISVMLNFRPVTKVLRSGGSDCPATPDGATAVIPVAVFNAARRSGLVAIQLNPSQHVNAGVCRFETLVNVQVEYTASGEDADDNGVLDWCEGCEQAAPPQPPLPVTAKNRYLSVIPGSADRLLALRIRVEEAPARFATLKGATFWVDRPFVTAEAADSLGGLRGGPDYFTARLACDPVFFDFGSLETVHLHDARIIPGAVYSVSSVDFACGGVDDEQFFSSPLSMATSAWGDVVEYCHTLACLPPDGSVQITDVVAVLDKFRNRSMAVAKVQADLAGALPNRLVDMADVAVVLGAFLGEPFPYPVPARCEP